MLAEAFTKILNNENNVTEALERRTKAYLKLAFCNDPVKCLERQRTVKSERKACRLIMESIYLINDLTRECVRENGIDTKCKKHHPLRFSQPQMRGAKNISRNTDVFLKSISAFMAQKAQKLEQAKQAIITNKKRNENGSLGEDEVVPDDNDVESYKKKEKTFKTLSMKIYWFVNHMAEKQRQTYGVYPFFPKK